MRILDENGTEVHDPDLTKGRLVTEVIMIAHHPAEPERPAEYESVEVEPGLYERRQVTPWQPARGAWDETETIQRYVPYTADELAAMEREREEAEEAAKRDEEAARDEAERQATLNALPQRVDDIEEGLAEIGVMAADASVSMDDLMEAVAELGAMVAELSE